jgi:hypothetical protein
MKKTYKIKITPKNTFDNFFLMKEDLIMDVSLEELKKLIKANPELLEKDDGKPESGSIYWNLDTWNNVVSMPWINSRGDNYRRDIGNFFLTEEECKAQQEINLAISRVRAYIRDNDLELEDIDWNDNSCRYSIHYNHYTKKIDWFRLTICDYGIKLPYLKSVEACKQLIDNNLSDLKLIYGIK